MRWAEGGSCRHDAILRYFGDEAETLAGCGRCDVCRQLDGGEAVDDAETTLMVRKALSAVARVDRRYGLSAAAKLLAGIPDPRLVRAGLDRTPTFGVLKGHSEPWLTQLLRRCVTAGWVDFTSGERPLVVLTRPGRDVMKGDRPVRLVLPRTVESGTGSRRSPRPAAKAGGVGTDEALPAEAEPVFAALRRLRQELARADAVPAYVVASDRTLRDVALLRPRTLEELQQAHGIGPAKAERYGRQLLEVVAKASA
jgi:ATP-dependent DNA helicase RecQ